MFFSECIKLFYSAELDMGLFFRPNPVHRWWIRVGFRKSNMFGRTCPTRVPTIVWG